ncbi:MAG: valine--tRNA ligase [Candidatus Micrarchaeota archaeon]|nr:valine--tRNA ligase [Candidatus Micrarchaeota archaeon]MCX8154279.1 valine--tRNA ligase [Candidatus Micrarchaeota archaeon]
MFEDIEKKWQAIWESKPRKYDPNREILAIDTPPPFTSGTLHMGHILSYSYIDFIARYKMLRGYTVFYPQGWDAQGFPTEIKIENKYGRDLPREEFRQRCVEWSYEMIDKMKSQMRRMGYMIDWNHEYITMLPEYHRMVQESVIQMWKQGDIYRDNHPVLWCPHCESAIAKAELEDRDFDAVLYDIDFGTVKISTTRPELLHACVAVMVHPEDERYRSSVGKTAILPIYNREVPIIADQDVIPEFGTGAVMVCTYGDYQDLVWQKRHNLPVIEGIDKHGKLKNSNYDGLDTQSARERIVEDLKRLGAIVREQRYKKIVKVHDRCKNPVELIYSYEWFASLRKHRDKLIEVAKSIRWTPEFGIYHYIDWLNNLDWDWIISRDRVFGTPLPFYVCSKCNHIEPADSLPFYPERAEPKTCPKCGSYMSPESKVLDVWIDSSITPLVVSKYYQDRKFSEATFPNYIRIQGVEIVRTWALYTIYRVWRLTGKIPWREILLNGNVLAPDGRKMSKSLGNVISPDDLLKEYPVDALRQWAAMSGALAKDRPFSYEDIKYAKAFLIKYWNASKYVLSKLQRVSGNVRLRKVDRWILHRLSEVIRDVTDAMDRYEFREAITTLHKFYWNEFCDFYLEYTKWRFQENVDVEGAVYTLTKVQEEFSKMFSVFAPHLAYEVYWMMFGKEIDGWPTFSFYDEDAKREVERFNREVSMVRTYKISNRMSIKTPIESWKTNDHFDQELSEELRKVMNIKVIV